MAVFLISYDLIREPRDDYEKVHDKIKSISEDWLHLQLSTFVVSSELSPYEIRDFLNPVFRVDEKLIVAELSGRIAGRDKFNNVVGAWFARNGMPSI